MTKQIRRFCAAFLVVCFFVSIISAAEESIGRKGLAPSTPADRLSTDLKYLSSDLLEGRGVETAGIELAGDYIARQWKELGLKTDLFDGTPFQKLDIDGAYQLGSSETNRLLLRGPDNIVLNLELKSQFIPVSLGRNGTFDAPLVFAGYGITADDARIGLKYDDFADVDVRNKVVIVIRKEPQQKNPNSLFSGTQPSRYALFNAKESNAAAHNVAAMILVNDSVTIDSNPSAGDPLPGLDASGEASSQNRVPTFFVRREQIDRVLQDSIGKKLADIESEIDLDLRPRSVELPQWRVSGQADLTKTKLKSRNVVAVLPGEGELAKEYLVIGAHYDHVGMGGIGSLAPGTVEVHNGADDNGSGTVTLLEVSRRIASSLTGPHRTIVFIAFTGEERGLLGSKYYVRNPRFPLENTVAMINLDMVGRLNNDELTVYGTGTAKEFDALVDEVNASFRFKIDKVPAGLGPSDHASFYEQRIPVFHLFTGLHNDYHRPSDDFDKINVTGMVRITDMVSQMAIRIASTPDRPTYREVRGSARPTQQSPRRPQVGRLGIQLATNGIGLFVEQFLSGSAAEKAGLLVGDRITRLAGVEIATAADLQRQMSFTKPGDKIVVEIERDGQRQSIDVDL